MQSVSTLATNQGRAMAVANGAAFYNDPKRVLTDLDRYSKVTAKDIQRVAQTYINGDWIFYELVPAGKAGAPAPAATATTEAKK